MDDLDNMLPQLICNRLWYIARTGKLDACTDYRSIPKISKFRIFQFYFSLGGNNIFIAILNKRVLGVVKACLVLTDEEAIYYGIEAVNASYESNGMRQIYDDLYRIPGARVTAVVGVKCPVLDCIKEFKYDEKTRLLSPYPEYPTLEPVHGYTYNESKGMMWNLLTLATIKARITKPDKAAKQRKKSKRQVNREKQEQQYEEAMSQRPTKKATSPRHVRVKRGNGFL